MKSFEPTTPGKKRSQNIAIILDMAKKNKGLPGVPKAPTGPKI